MKEKRITTLAEPVQENDAVTKKFLDGWPVAPPQTSSGHYDLQAKHLTNVAAPTDNHDAINRKWLQNQIAIENSYV